MPVVSAARSILLVFAACLYFGSVVLRFFIHFSKPPSSPKVKFSPRMLQRAFGGAMQSNTAKRHISRLCRHRCASAARVLFGVIKWRKISEQLDHFSALHMAMQISVSRRNIQTGRPFVSLMSLRFREKVARLASSCGDIIEIFA